MKMFRLEFGILFRNNPTVNRNGFQWKSIKMQSLRFHCLEIGIRWNDNLVDFASNGLPW